MLWMATATATRLSRSERRERILAAAAEAFAARGYHAASVGQIADAAGITKPVVYDHFASKGELFVELMESAREELTTRGFEAMSGGSPLEERLRAGVTAFFAYVEEHPATARVLFTPPTGEPDLLRAAQRVQAEATASIAAMLDAEPELLAGARDRKRRLELFAEFFKQGVHGLAIWWSEHPRVPRRALVDATMDLLWAGMRAQLTPTPS
jgi:AcrR family transcriptional regulator